MSTRGSKPGRVFLFLPTLMVAILWPLAVLADVDPAPNHPRPEVQVFKLPTCGCCRTWVKYLEASGFPVKATDTMELITIRAEHGVPPKLAGCHTALVSGYVIEGHVSVAEIERLLTERPAIKGLVVPGMPQGAPGMEGIASERYEVLALHNDGTTSVYATHEAAPESSDDDSSSDVAAPVTPVSPTDAVP